jgi:hypothetical protein
VLSLSASCELRALSLPAELSQCVCQKRGVCREQSSREMYSDLKLENVIENFADSDQM